MLKLHKNAFLKVIEKKGLDVKHFHAKDRKNYLFSSSVNSAFEISIRGFRVKYIVRYSGSFDNFTVVSNGRQSDFSRMTINSNLSLAGALNDFRDWLNDVATKFIAELTLPDLWLQLTHHHFLAKTTPISDEDTSKFSDQEKIQVKQSVDEFRKLIYENFKSTQQQVEIINNQLDYLISAVDRLNRFDWQGLAISTLISIAINLSVDTTGGKLLFQLFNQAFNSISRLLPG